MLCLSLCLYSFSLVFWILDIIIVQKELLVFMPIQLSSSPASNVYAALTEMLGVHWYVQAVCQMIIVSDRCFCILKRTPHTRLQWTLSDGVVLWRAYTVFGRPRWLKLTVVVMICLEIGEPLSAVNRLISRVRFHNRFTT